LYGNKLIDIASERRVQVVSIAKTLVFPAVMFLLVFFLPLDPLIKSILIIQSSTPTQATAAAFSKNFGGDSVIAAKIVFLATIISLLTIPLFLILINL
jgi:predicted permease